MTTRRLTTMASWALMFTGCFYGDIHIDPPDLPGLDESSDGLGATSLVALDSTGGDSTDGTSGTTEALDSTGSDGSSTGLESSTTASSLDTGEPCTPVLSVAHQQCECEENGDAIDPGLCGPCYTTGFQQCECDGVPGAPLEWCGSCEIEQGTCYCQSDESPLEWCQGPCTQEVAYRSCDPECFQPCAEGLACVGDPDQEVCTTGCLDADQCPPTMFPDPWAVPACIDGQCVVPCDGEACPNPGVYMCEAGVCVPYPECTMVLGTACDLACPVPCATGSECIDGVCA